MISRLLPGKSRNIHCDTHAHTHTRARTAALETSSPSVRAGGLQWRLTHGGGSLASVRCLSGSILSMNGFVSHAFTRRYVERCRVPAGLVGGGGAHQRARERERERAGAPSLGSEFSCLSVAHEQSFHLSQKQRAG